MARPPIYYICRVCRMPKEGSYGDVCSRCIPTLCAEYPCGWCRETDTCRRIDARAAKVGGK